MAHNDEACGSGKQFWEMSQEMEVEPHRYEHAAEDTDCRCENRRISGKGSRTVRLGRMVTGGKGHEVLPRFGPS